MEREIEEGRGKGKERGRREGKRKRREERGRKGRGKRQERRGERKEMKGIPMEHPEKYFTLSHHFSLVCPPIF